jgi:hypothetical protein
MNTKQISTRKLGLFAILSFTAILLMGASAFVVRSQGDTIGRIAQNLRAQKVPLKSIDVKDRFLFRIEIAINSTGQSQQDMWNAQLAYREASLAHRYGLPVGGVTLTVTDANGKQVDWGESFFGSSDPSRIATPPAHPKIDATTAKSMIIEQIQKLALVSMKLDSVAIAKSAVAGYEGASATIQFKANDTEAAKKEIPLLVGATRQFMENLNQDGASITIYQMRVVDANGQALLEYLWDLETRTERSVIAPGVEPWYPRPKPTTVPFVSPLVTPSLPLTSPIATPTK